MKKRLFVLLGVTFTTNAHALYYLPDQYMWGASGVAATNTECWGTFSHNESKYTNLVDEYGGPYERHAGDKAFADKRTRTDVPRIEEYMLLDNEILRGYRFAGCTPHCVGHTVAVAKDKTIYECTKDSADDYTTYSWKPISKIEADNFVYKMDSANKKVALVDENTYGLRLYDVAIDPSSTLRWVGWCDDGYMPLKGATGVYSCTEATMACTIGYSTPTLTPIGLQHVNSCDIEFSTQYGKQGINGWPFADNPQCVYTCTEKGWSYRLLNSDQCVEGYRKKGDLDCELDPEYANICNISGGDGWQTTDGTKHHLECKCDSSKHLKQTYNRLGCECEDTYKTVLHDDGSFNLCRATSATDIKSACLELGDTIATWDELYDVCVCKDNTKYYSKKNGCNNIKQEYESCINAKNTHWTHEGQCECITENTAWNGEECDEILALEMQLCHASGGTWDKKTNGKEYCNCSPMLTQNTRFNGKKYTHCKCNPDEYGETRQYVPSLEQCMTESDINTYRKKTFDATKWLEEHSKVVTSGSVNNANDTQESISTLVANLSKIESEFGLSKWRTAEGKFNYARLASDATAGIVLGTTGALVTAHVVKKKQVEDGFESLECTVGGQHVGDWGDVFRIDGK